MKRKGNPKLSSSILNRKVPVVYCPKKPDTVRNYLTADELKRLIETPCEYKQLKHAFLFSCFTGLRKSDIMQLRWNEIINDNKHWHIYKVIQKTQRCLSIPLSKQALRWLPKKKHNANDDDHVFDIMSNSSLSQNINKWIYISDKTSELYRKHHRSSTLMI